MLTQSTPPKEVLVIDDCSKDKTSAAARKAGARVVRPPVNTGSKAGAQNFALKQIETKYVMAIDADTTLDKYAIERLMTAFDERKLAAVCGSVIPRYVSTIWERGRYIEYLFAFAFYKPIQNYYNKPLISSGCFSAYNTKILKAAGGWSTRTLAEDMDLTWSFYEKGYKVNFISDAVCYPIEPHTFSFMKKQLKRWSHGFVQNVRIHFKNMAKMHYLRSTISVGMWDSIVSSVSYLFLIPLTVIITKNPIFLLAYVIDIPAVSLPVILKGVERRETGRVLASIPSFIILRFVNCYFILEAFTSEVLLNKNLNVYEKGH